MKRGEAAASQQDTIAAAAAQTLRKPAFLFRKPMADQHELYTLTKNFFKAYLKKEREFTISELELELHRVFLSRPVRERLDAFLAKLAPLEYTDKQYSQEDIKAMLQELDRIVHELVSERKKNIPMLTRLANWLLRKRIETPHDVISDYPALETNDPTAIEINTLLEQVYAALDIGKHAKAARIYKQLLHRYDSLGRSAQHEFYHKINAAYAAIKRQGK